jgi:phenylacetate-CoA ligase
MSEYLDALETRAPDARERELMLRLPKLIALAQQAPGWQRILGQTVAANISSRAALAQ